MADRRDPVRPVWWCVRAALRQDWRGLAALALITTLMGAVALTALAGARRTDTGVARFLQYAGPFQGEVATDLATMDKIAALPGVAYTERGALMLAMPVSSGGRPIPAPEQGQVITEAIVSRAPEARGIVLAGRYAVPSRANEVVLNESAAVAPHVASVLEMRGYRPPQIPQVMNGTRLRPAGGPGCYSPAASLSSRRRSSPR